MMVCSGNTSEGVRGRVLVTGGAGFIGRYVLQHLIGANFEVHCLDLRASPVALNGGSWIVDLRDAQATVDALAAIDPHYVIHLAALATLSSNEGCLYESNVQATENLIAALTETVRRTVYVSTQLVVEMGVEPGDGSTYQPYSLYGESKAEMERLIRRRAPTEWVIARPTTIWGPHHPTMGTSIFRYIKKGWYLHPITERPVIRGYGYVENAAAQIVCLMEAATTPSRVFYVGEQPMDSGVFVDALSIALRGRPVRRVPLGLLRMLGKAGDLAKRLGLRAPLDSGRVFRMTTDYVVPVTPMLDLCGTSPVSFEDAVGRTVDWINGHA